jgi:hypothetical protein
LNSEITCQNQLIDKNFGRPGCNKDWLVAVESTVGQQAKCSICNVVVISRVASLKQHLESKKHKDNAKVVFGKVQTKLPFTCGDIMGVKKAECQLALYVAGHTSINAIDHLSEICRDCFKGCESAEKLQLHRAKCGQIIKNVLATHFNEDLVQDIGDSPFGLLIDESTDTYLGDKISWSHYNILQHKTK